MVRLFKEACDVGRENVDVSLFLLTHPLRGPGLGTVIVGKSVHNQRIESMWRDVYWSFTGYFWKATTC